MSSIIADKSNKDIAESTFEYMLAEILSQFESHASPDIFEKLGYRVGTNKFIL